MDRLTPDRFTLIDGTKIVVRTMDDEDLESSLTFFRALNDEERLYLRTDVTKRENVVRRIEQMKSGLVHRIVATCEEEIIADGALELSEHGWEQHVGEMRIFVADRYQRKGLGMILARELYHIASKRKVEEIVVRMMRTQVAAQKIFRKLGFHEETLLQDYVKDLRGQAHDLIIMKCNLKELWKEMEAFYEFSDMGRHR